MDTKVIEFEKGVDEAVQLIQAGRVIACCTDTVYGLSCDPFNMAAVEEVYRLKDRNKSNPLLLIAHKDFDISKLVFVDKLSEKYIEKYWPGAVTFIFNIKDEKLKALSCGKNTIAIRKPDNSLLQKLLSKTGILTSTSANLSGHDVAKNADEVLLYFKNKLPLILDGGQSANSASTIVDLSGGEVKVLRQGDVVVK